MKKEKSIEVKELQTRIIKYRLFDKKNGAVIYYTLDLDKYQLAIQGEVEGAYKWCETPTEDFLSLMVRCDRGYLLNKLFTRHFSCELSIKELLKYIKSSFEYEFIDNKKQLFSEISEIDTDSAELFMQKVHSVFQIYNIPFDDYEICCCCEDDYYYWEKKSISYFCNNIKPHLRRQIKKQREMISEGV